MPHAACLPCCIARASRPVRCRSGRHHSVARICLSCPLFLCCTLPCHCHCHCRVWEFGNGRNVAMPSADFLGREKQGEETRQLVRTNRLRRVGCLLITVSRTPPGRSRISLYIRGGFVDDDSVHVLPDLPRLVVALCFSRPARALVELAPAECRANRAKLFRLTGVLAREPGSFEKAGTGGFLCLVFPFLLSCSLIPPVGSLILGPIRTPVRALSSCWVLAFPLG